MNPQYLEQMENLLGQDFPAYEESLKDKPYRGFRINLLKTNEKDFFSCFSFAYEKSPFISNGYYLLEDAPIGNTILHHAGILYMQEPSASLAVSVLDPKPGMKILDMCAAPGSKTTAIAERMDHSGFLVANEINTKRAQVLKENIEKNGTANCLVLNSAPHDLSEDFPCFFDAVLCDAPCSGEGMFRKEPQAEKDWSKDNIRLCVRRQKDILEHAYRCLKPGGILVYSTCTFNLEENELQLVDFLKNHEDMHMEKTGTEAGRSGFSCGMNTEYARRVFPMDKGEGHFVARMRKDGEEESYMPDVLKSQRLPKEAVSFLKENLQKEYPYYYMNHDKIYAGTSPFYASPHCRLVRHQILLGEMKNHRFEPSHHFFTSAFSDFTKYAELDEAEIMKYLHGEEILKTADSGWTAVSWNGYVLGGAKSDGKHLKNKYPKNLRIR
ncbi:MAG: NOL1/NOP2/sun family putative RNA methylase [Solobacterium sp.]|nr:NOL1/NOP2/sun family putative RNA methylase [Solobacterium sp.]